MLMYCSETIVWNKRNKSKEYLCGLSLWCVWSLWCVKKMKDERERELWSVKKEVNLRIKKCVKMFGYIERMEDNRLVKWMCSGEYVKN